MIITGDGGSAQAGRPGQAQPRSLLGLGSLETAIMGALWRAGGWVMIQHIRDTIDYHRAVAYQTVATVTGNLCDKGLVHRKLGDRNGHPGCAVWWYRAARPQTEHIGELIAALLDHSPDPTAALAHALATTRTAIDIHTRTQTKEQFTR
jgi:predicted transcriptional regulator